MESTSTQDSSSQLPASGANRKAPLSEGNLWKVIWTMSWPLMLSTTTSSIVGMVDVHVSGILGSSSQAAVGLSEQILFMFLVFVLSVGVGTTAVVSRAWGAENRAEAELAAAQSLSLSLLLGITLAFLSWLLARLALPVFSNSPDVIRQGQIYLSIFGLYLIPFSVVSVINASFRAIGDAKTPLVVVLVMTTVNIVGDYITVMGNWPVPNLGVLGIAYAAVAADLAGMIIAIWCLWRSPLKGCLKYLRPIDSTMMRRVANIGIPSAFQRLSWTAAVFVLFFILSFCPQPTQALASWTIGMRVEGILFMPLMALSMAVSSIVGQNLGAHKPERAFTAGWHVTYMGILLLLGLSVALYVFAPQLAAVMSHDPVTITYTVDYLRINAIAEPFLALGMILSGALQGAGDTRSPMWISIFSNWIVRLPLAWLLAITLKMGPTGAWIAMSSSMALTGLLMTWRYQGKTWLKTKV